MHRKLHVLAIQSRIPNLDRRSSFPARVFIQMAPKTFFQAHFSPCHSFSCSFSWLFPWSLWLQHSIWLKRITTHLWRLTRTLIGLISCSPSTSKGGSFATFCNVLSRALHKFSAGISCFNKIYGASHLRSDHREVFLYNFYHPPWQCQHCFQHGDVVSRVSEKIAKRFALD